MDIFQEVKARSNILQVCDLLGLKLDRSNKCLCPFHKESTPSFSVSERKQVFKCFGCGKGGDSIALVSEILKCNPIEAAKFISQNLKLGIDTSYSRNNFKYINEYEQKRKAREQYEKWKNENFIKLCKKLHEIEDRYYKKCEEINSIERADEFFNDKDVLEYCNNVEYIQYCIDFFIFGSEEDLLWVKKQKERWLNYE